MTEADARGLRPARRYSLWQRFTLWLAGWLGPQVIRAIGCTLRFTTSIEEGGPPDDTPRPSIYAFWHRCVFPAVWRFRNSGIAVMTSRSLDGEYIARVIGRLGYVPVRGSSSRGAVGALLGMRRQLQAGAAVAFTIDGPRGPRYVAKPGPMLLAKKTGLPVVAFYIALERPWVLRSWDAFMVPRPFSRALLRASRSIHVSPDADEEELARLHQELQEALERARHFAEEHVARGAH